MEKIQIKGTKCYTWEGTNYPHHTGRAFTLIKLGNCKYKIFPDGEVCKFSKGISISYGYIRQNEGYVTYTPDEELQRFFAKLVDFVNSYTQIDEMVIEYDEYRQFVLKEYK